MDITQTLLNDPLCRTILSLLAASFIDPSEKQLWLMLLPVMNEYDKNELKENLAEQIQVDDQMSDEMLTNFINKFQEVAA